MLETGWVIAPSVWVTTLVLGYVTLQRAVELKFAERNTARLKAEGAFEVAAPHYPLLVAVHLFWLTIIWISAFGEFINLFLLLLFAIVQILRFWTLASIGRRWTTRIIVRRGEKLVARGPYRFMAHPNYLVVTLEIALLPSVFGLYAIAILFSLLNAGALFIRIRAETRALSDFTQGRKREVAL